MGKNDGNLGRAMIKSRMMRKSGNMHGEKTGWRAGWKIHTTDLDDGADWSKTNFQSITEQNSLDEFLTTAELAGTDFEAERLNIKIIQKPKIGLLTKEEKERIRNAQDEHRDYLRIPRRPLWKDNSELTSEEYTLKERDSFLVWRKKLAELQDVESISLTPFEKNLEFWKQLWRVIERSDVVVQIVDGRNPLLFRCEDLESYISEVDKNKISLILINKSDLLTLKQRVAWLKYFEKINCKVVFWSAHDANEANAAELKLTQDQPVFSTLKTNKTKREHETITEGSEEEGEQHDEDEDEDEYDDDDEDDDDEEEEETLAEEIKNLKTEENPVAKEAPRSEISDSDAEKCKVLTREELIHLFKTIHKDLEKNRPGSTTIGMVGYPNVGKSSTINALLQTKRVAVSETPGKTKHYQTLFIDDELLLCDCPGLVFPSFVATKGDLILNGILPVDQMRNYVEPMNLMCQHIPNYIFEITYGIMLPKPGEGEDPDRPSTGEELCSVYSYAHGYLTHRGLPDVQRGARYLIKDYINGKLVYCYPPPGYEEKEFQEHKIDPIKEAKYLEKCRKIEQRKDDKSGQTDFDADFFSKLEARAVSKGAVAGYSRVNNTTGASAAGEPAGKPWKKHFKGNKREKLRIKNAHLDK